MSRMAPLSAQVVAKIRLHRLARRLSTQKFAGLVTAAGYPVNRSVLANMESDRRDNIPLDYAAAAAQALGITLVDLLNAPVCTVCVGDPPAGFTCNSCGAKAADQIEESR